MLRSKRVWLIGASEGIGAALAGALAAKGATLILSARQAEKLGALAATLAGSGHRSVPLDVTSSDRITEAWDVVKPLAPELVIYNAGAYDPLNAKEFDLQKIEHMVDVNFIGALRVISHVLPMFLAQRQGHLALVGSVAAYRGLPNAIGYGASKAALLHLGENLRTDLEDTGIKVQVISPGFVKTRLTAKNDFPMPFIISPEQAADYIVRGLESPRFEIDFPKRFSLFLKFLRMLPHATYFWVVRTLL